MNAKKARALRQRARRATSVLPAESYRQDGRTQQLGECTKGAYRALKTGKVVMRSVAV